MRGIKHECSFTRQLCDIIASFGVVPTPKRNLKQFSPRYRVQTGSEAHPVSYPTATGTLTPETKRPGREADHSPLSSAFTISYVFIP